MGWSWGNIDWEQTLAGLVGIATLTQAFVAVVMMRSLGHSRVSAEAAVAGLEHARAAHQQQTRAWVDLQGAVIEARQANHPMRIHVRVTNTGGTRASNYSAKVFWLIGRTEELDAVELPDLPQDSQGAIGAGQDMDHYLVVPAAQWVPNWSDVESGEQELRIVGHATYEDVFGHAHRTKFSAHFRPTEHPTFLSLMLTGNEGD